MTKIYNMHVPRRPWGLAHASAHDHKMNTKLLRVREVENT